MLLYYITDRAQFPGSEHSRREQLLNRIAEAARAGVEYIQLREKDLPSRDLEELASAAVKRVRDASATSRILINSRTDIALAVGADGVHLRSHDVSPADVRRIWRSAGGALEPVVAVSCHTHEEVKAAKLAEADFVVFGPVFGKAGSPGAGLAALQIACSHGVAVLALGGVTSETAKSCAEAGATGVAGVRMFQEGDVQATLSSVRR